MTFRRSAIIGASFVAALALFATGCDKSTDDSETKPDAAAVNPVEALVNAATSLEKTTFTLKIVMGNDGGEMTAEVDTPNKLVHSVMAIGTGEEAVGIENIVVGTDLYAKTTMGGKPAPGADPDKWRHSDITKRPEANTLGLKPGQVDPSSAVVFMKAVTTATQPTPGNFAGSIDASKAVGASGLTAEDITKLGDKAKAVPFQATIDADGRLTKMFIDMPAIGTDPAQSMTATYTDFGAKVDVVKPAADQVVENPLGQ